MFEFITCIILIVTIYILIDALMPEGISDALIQRRLTEIKEGEVRRGSIYSDEVYNDLAKKEKLKKSNLLAILREQSDYRVQFIGEFINRFKFIEKVKYNLKLADIKMPVDLFIICVSGSILFFLFIGMLTKNIIFLLIGIVAGVAPFMFLKMKYTAKKEKFTQQFPDALGIISNSLRAGHSLIAAFQTVASESDYPTNKLFKTVSDEISLGREIRETMTGMADNLPGSQDLKFFITAILIQREVGGNLAEILDNLSVTIRERYKLMGMIKTQTAQAQMSGMVLGFAPVAITLMVNAINPGYMKPLFNEPMGQGALAASAFLSIFGFVIIKKVTQIRV